MGFTQPHTEHQDERQELRSSPQVLNPPLCHVMLPACSPSLGLNMI